MQLSRYVKGLAAVMCLAMQAERAGAGNTAIAVEGDAAPGGGTFTSLSSLVYLGEGNSNVAFTAAVAGFAPGASGTGIFRYDSPGLDLIGRSGLDIGGLTPSKLSLGGIDSFGIVAGGFTHVGGTAVFVSNGASAGSVALSVPAYTGMVVGGGTLGGGSFTFGPVGGTVVSNGRIAFTGATSDGTNGSWGQNIISPAGLTQYFRGGTINLAGSLLNVSGIGSASISNTGDIVLDAALSGSSDHALLHFGSSGGFVTARSGSLTPGGAGSFAASAFKSPIVTQNGLIAFMADLNTATGASQGIYRSGSSLPLTEIARKGTSSGAGTFDSFQSIDMNSVGQIAFRAAENYGGAGPRSGIWRSSSGIALTKIVVPGDPGPGGVGTFSSASLPQINSNGLVAFDGSVGTSKGLFLGDGSETFQVIGTGSALLGSTVSTFNWNYLIDRGGQSPLDADGQLAYSVLLNNNASAVMLFTPDLHWRPLGGVGEAGDPRNWTLSIRPSAVHDVFLDGGAIASGFGRRSVKSLTIGTPVLASQLTNSSLYLNISHALTINAGSRLTWTSTDQLTAASMLNDGSFSQSAGSASFGAISGNGSINISSSANVVADSVQQNRLSVIVSGKLSIRPNGTESAVSVIHGFFSTDAGRLDLSNNTLIHDYTGASSIQTIGSAIRSGYNNGSWSGTGINSSTAAADLTHSTALGFAEATDLFSAFPATFRGQPIDSSSVLIRYTLVGDANLDGTVDSTDFNALAASFGAAGTRWSLGDFNYDQSTDTLDFDQLAAQFGNTLAVPVAAALVPEPLSWIGAGVFALALRTRRRK
jgi:hypothetical protein